MPISSEQRAKVQAAYLKALYDKALDLYETTVEKPPIDPQGRVILDVTFDDIWELIKLPDDSEEISTKEELEDILGHPIADVTSVSLDIQVPVSQNKGTDKLSEKLKVHLPATEQEKILDAYKGLAKGRIISLQQETHFHAHLIGRMVKAAVKEGETLTDKQARELKNGDTDEKFQEAIHDALLDLNKFVLKLQAKALKTAYAKANILPFPYLGERVLDEQKFKSILNQELDAARKKLLPKIAKTVRTKLIQKTGILFNKAITQHLSKHLAEETSAIPHDYVHVDKGTGSINFIGASEHTSHHQELGEDFLADRMMYSHHLARNGNVIPLSRRQQVRVPSIAVKRLHDKTIALLEQDKTSTIPFQNVDIRLTLLDSEQNLSAKETKQIKDEYSKFQEVHSLSTPTDDTIKVAVDQMIVKDTADKICFLQEKYQLAGEARERGSDEAHPNAFVYNLYTTLNYPFTGAWDEGSNKQTQSAEHILAAAHVYNRNNPDHPLCLVQNMGVNGWGYPLSIAVNNPEIVNEATLMTQMASLHTIYDRLEGESKGKVDELFKAYKDFLDKKPAQSSFYAYLRDQERASEDEPTLLENLPTMKSQLKVISGEKTSDINNLEEHRTKFVDNATTALAKLYQDGEYGKKENGFTYQALSVFVENASIGGCKSANERAQAVNGRVAILDFVSLDKTTRDSILDEYLSTKESARIKVLASDLETGIHEGPITDITKPLNDLYESLNLEGFQAVISFIDQGGHAKLGTKGSGWDTNNCETIQTHVENASKWQCHKGLSDYVLQEFCGIKSFDKKKEGVMAATRIFGGAFIGLCGGAAAFGIVATLAVFGVSFAFPPLGIVLGMGVGVAAGIGAGFALARVISKLWNSRDAATEKRFGKLIDDNTNLIKEVKTTSSSRSSSVSSTDSYRRIPGLINSETDRSRHIGSSQKPRSSTSSQLAVSSLSNTQVNIVSGAAGYQVVSKGRSGSTGGSSDDEKHDSHYHFPS